MNNNFIVFSGTATRYLTEKSAHLSELKWVTSMSQDSLTVNSPSATKRASAAVTSSSSRAHFRTLTT